MTGAPLWARTVRLALRGTGIGLASRWRMLSTRSGRAGAWTALVVSLLALTGAASLGDTVRAFAEYDSTTTAGIYARTYLTEWAGDGFGTIAAGVVGFVVVITLFAPLVGSVPPALIPVSDGPGFVLARRSRFTDSFITHVVSLTTALQVLALTALASLVTLDGSHRARALVIVWMAWIVSVAVSVAISWTVELMRRTKPKAPRWITAGAVAAAGLLLAADPEHGATLFGLGAPLTRSLRSANLITVMVVLVAALVTALTVGWMTSGAVLRKPELVTTNRAVRRREMPSSPGRALWVATWRSVWRTPAVRTPMLVVAGLSVGVSTVAGATPQVLAGLMVTVPLMLTLAWSVNSLVVLGGAGPWLLSMPGAGRRILLTHSGLAWTTIVAGTTLCWVGASARGLVDMQDAVRIVSCSVAVATAYSTVGAHMSFTRARPAALESGAAVLAPARTLAMTLILLVTLGLGTAALLIGTTLTQDRSLPLSAHLLWCAGATVVFGSWWVVILRRWSTNPVRRAAAVAAAHR